MEQFKNRTLGYLTEARIQALISWVAVVNTMSAPSATALAICSSAFSGEPMLKYALVVIALPKTFSRCRRPASWLQVQGLISQLYWWTKATFRWSTPLIIWMILPFSSGGSVTTTGSAAEAPRKFARSWIIVFFSCAVDNCFRSVKG